MASNISIELSQQHHSTRILEELAASESNANIEEVKCIDQNA